MKLSESAKERNIDRAPSNQRDCPVCGKTANAKYWNEIKTKWIYKHSSTGSLYVKETIYHEADR